MIPTTTSANSYAYGTIVKILIFEKAKGMENLHFLDSSYNLSKIGFSSKVHSLIHAAECNQAKAILFTFG